jgi:putative phage-type endonuclease
MLTNEERRERQNYIGGSDVGAILGYNQYRSSLDVYLEKVEGEYKDESDNWFIYWGNKNEPQIRSIFSEITDYKVTLPKTAKFHKEYAFLGGHVDGIVNGGEAILEIKNVSPYSREKWGSPDPEVEKRLGFPKSHNGGFKNERGYVPDSYLFQCLHYLSIYEIDKLYLAVKFGNDMPIRAYQIDRNKEIEKILLEKLSNFWYNNINKKLPPDPTTIDDIKKLYPTSIADSSVVATNNICEKYETLLQLQEEEKILKGKSEAIKNELKVFMKESELLIDITGQKLCSWKGCTSARFDSKKFKEENKELAGKYINETSSRRFLLY